MQKDFLELTSIQLYLYQTIISNELHVSRYCFQEFYDAIMNIKMNKSYRIGVLRKCIKVAGNHISEALSIVFNESSL